MPEPRHQTPLVATFLNALLQFLAILAVFGSPHGETVFEARMCRFLGTRSGRKIEYAGLLAGWIDPNDDGSPLVRILAHSSRRRKAPSRHSCATRQPLPE